MTGFDLFANIVEEVFRRSSEIVHTGRGLLSRNKASRREVFFLVPAVKLGEVPRVRKKMSRQDKSRPVGEKVCDEKSCWASKGGGVADHSLGSCHWTRQVPLGVCRSMRERREKGCGGGIGVLDKPMILSARKRREKKERKASK